MQVQVNYTPGMREYMGAVYGYLGVYGLAK